MRHSNQGTGDQKINVGETKIKGYEEQAPPFEAIVEIMYEISRTGELVKIAADLDIIQKAGAWYICRRKIGQGSENAKEILGHRNYDEIDRRFGFIWFDRRQ